MNKLQAKHYKQRCDNCICDRDGAQCVLVLWTLLDDNCDTGVLPSYISKGDHPDKTCELARGRMCEYFYSKYILNENI